MTKTKNRNSLVKTSLTARKRRSGNNIIINEKRDKRVYQQFVKNVLRNKKTPNTSQTDIPETEQLNASKGINTRKSRRRYFSVQNREKIDGNNTINLSEDENEANESTTNLNDESNPSTIRNEIIEITKTSTNDENLTSSLIEEPEIIEIENKSTEDSILIDLCADDSAKCLSQDLDDIVILHANCTPQKDDIEILSHKKLPRKRKFHVLESLTSTSPKSRPSQTTSPKSKGKQTEKPSSDNLKLNIENNSAPNFIPLVSSNNKQKNNNNYFNQPIPTNKMKNRKYKNKMKNVKRLSANSLSPNSKLEAIGTNVYSDKPLTVPSSGLRPIIIDGSNVAYHHSNNRHFSCKGLEICINYFKRKGHKVTAFVPQYRLKMNCCDNPRLLNELVEQGDVILTPSRIIDGRPVVSYDDRYIVQTAALKEGIIVTRDNYNDLLGENPAWRDTIKYRLLQFTWVDDVLMFPNDPLGKFGPNLERFLRF